MLPGMSSASPSHALAALGMTGGSPMSQAPPLGAPCGAGVALQPSAPSNSVGWGFNQSLPLAGFLGQATPQFNVQSSFPAKVAEQADATNEQTNAANGEAATLDADQLRYINNLLAQQAEAMQKVMALNQEITERLAGVGSSSASRPNASAAPLASPSNAEVAPTSTASQMIGSWEYGHQGEQYHISEVDGTRLRFDERHWKGHHAFGTLLPQAEWFVGELNYAEGGHVGTIRLRLSTENGGTLISSFRGAGDTEWDPDTSSQRVLAPMNVANAPGGSAPSGCQQMGPGHSGFAGMTPAGNPNVMGAGRTGHRGASGSHNAGSLWSCCNDACDPTPRSVSTWQGEQPYSVPATS